MFISNNFLKLFHNFIFLYTKYVLKKVYMFLSRKSSWQNNLNFIVYQKRKILNSCYKTIMNSWAYPISQSLTVFTSIGRVCNPWMLCMQWLHCHFKLYHNFSLFKSLSVDSMISHRLTSKLQWFPCRVTNLLYSVTYSVLKARAGTGCWISTSSCRLCQGEDSLCMLCVTFVILHSPSWIRSGFWCN